MPWIYWLNDFLTPVIGNRLGIAARHGTIRQFAPDRVKDRNGTAGGSDLLTDLYNVHTQKPEEMNDMAVLSMATSNIFAGSDTTAISLGSIIYHLLRNQVAKKKLL
jgi:cytochrome P450